MEQIHNNHPEGSPWFWKLFGGTILGFLGVLLMLIINNISGNLFAMRSEMVAIIGQMKTENDNQFAKIKDDISNLKSQIAALEEFRTSAKAGMASLETNVKDRNQLTDANVTALRESDKNIEAQVRELRERFLQDKK